MVVKIQYKGVSHSCRANMWVGTHRYQSLPNSAQVKGLHQFQENTALFLRLLFLALTYLKRWIERHIKYPLVLGKGPSRFILHGRGCWECNCLWFPLKMINLGMYDCAVSYTLWGVPFVMSLDESRLFIQWKTKKKKKKEWCVTSTATILKVNPLKDTFPKHP